MRLSLSHALALAALAGSTFSGSTLAQPTPTPQPASQPASQPTSPPPVQLKGLEYNAEFFPGATHDPAVPTPDSILGFRAGDKPMTYAQVQAILKALAANPAKSGQRVKLFDYATSHEGRTLSYLATTPAPSPPPTPTPSPTTSPSSSSSRTSSTAMRCPAPTPPCPSRGTWPRARTLTSCRCSTRWSSSSTRS